MAAVAAAAGSGLGAATGVGTVSGSGMVAASRRPLVGRRIFHGRLHGGVVGSRGRNWRRRRFTDAVWSTGSSNSQVISLKASHAAESQIAPVAMSGSGLFADPRRPDEGLGAGEALGDAPSLRRGFLQSAFQLAHQPSRLPLNIGFSTVLLSAER